MFTSSSLADSDPGQLEARASRVRQHNKLLRNPDEVYRFPQARWAGPRPGTRLAAWGYKKKRRAINQTFSFQ